MADYSKMKVVELKAELKRLGLPQNGLKAELVSRLEEATASEAGPTADAESESPAEEAATDPEPDEAQPSEGAEPANDAQELPEAEPADAEEPEPAPTAAQDSSANDSADDIANDEDPRAQTIVDTITLEAPPLPTPEVAHDVLKRKRRSTTPPLTEEVARKRLRKDDSEIVDDAASGAASDHIVSPKPENEGSDQVPIQDSTTEAVHDEAIISREPELNASEVLIGGDSANRFEVTVNTHNIGQQQSATAVFTASHTDDAGDSVMTDAGLTSHGGEEETYPASGDALDQQALDDPRRSLSPERDIEPSTHPATCALYIKNFMRPLRPQAVQEHLLELATPANAPLDPSIIVDFYLDNIRTHAFAVFTSVSAASRVRTALHKRVWPDETNRKALWIDFIPPECFEEWTDIEQQARNKGNMPRYEIVYHRDDDDNVTAKLEEMDANQATRRGPVSPVLHPDRKATIPTGPSRPSGIENAPTGPRNPYSHNGPATMYSNRQDTLESGFVKTRSVPPVLYRPAAPELVQRRLDRLAQAKDPHYNEVSGKDYHRYYFERDDVLVNRGPEIFLGIRPPHREKERRELARGGGDPRDRNNRDRRGPHGPPGGGGGGGRRGGRRRAPRPHGVPRGGDRFRPGGSSYDNRLAPDDRRDNYGGGRRKDGRRY